MTTPTAPDAMYRNDEGLGTWEHRGKVAAVGVGHSRTARRWDGRPETCVGAISIQALRQAIADAGVAPEQIDGLVVVPVTRRNGLMFPEGYWAQHRPEELGPEDYLAARWIAKPANLFDNDIPIMMSGAYLFSTAERAADMRQKPVYILNHASSNTRPRSLIPTLDEVEADTARSARKIYEGAGITADDLSFEDMYDGFSLFHQFHLEGLGYRGIQFGEALDFYQTDISIEGPNPVSPSGGNVGSGRSRIWMHTDCIQQLQGRAGARQVTGVKPEVAVSGGPMPLGGNFTVWSASPD